MKTETITVKKIILSEEELAKIITTAICIYVKGTANLQLSREKMEEMYEATRDSIQVDNLHVDFLESYEKGLYEIVETMPYVNEDMFKREKMEQIMHQAEKAQPEQKISTKL